MANSLELEDRMQKFTTKEAFVTIKDHKQSFPGKIQCRLINPAKCDLGRIAKVMLDRINLKVRELTELQQWRSTQDALQWFKSLPEGKNLTFLKFDIEAFYPSISRALLVRAIAFARGCFDRERPGNGQSNEIITMEDENIIIQAFDSFLFHEGEPWVKKNRNTNDGLFDKIGRAHV